MTKFTCNPQKSKEEQIRNESTTLNLKRHVGEKEREDDKANVSCRANNNGQS